MDRMLTAFSDTDISGDATPASDLARASGKANVAVAHLARAATTRRTAPNVTQTGILYQLTGLALAATTVGTTDGAAGFGTGGTSELASLKSIRKPPSAWEEHGKPSFEVRVKRQLLIRMHQEGRPIRHGHRVVGRQRPVLFRC